MFGLNFLEDILHNMTQAEFIAYAQISPNQAQVNIWYSDTAPYTIQGLTLPTVNVLGQDITAYLDQVQQVIVPISIGGVTQDITLNILTRQSYSTPGGNFYFFTVTPYVVSSITQGAFSGSLAEVSFTPAIDINVFNESPYNVLQGSVEETRKSDYIMLSDRYKVGAPGLPGYTGPTNINLLLSGSASLADVQDSLYSDTGWISARYTGTKTNSADYKVSPAVTGKIFKGAQYPYSGLTADLVPIRYQISSSIVIYSDYFYTGEGDTPGFSSTYITNIAVSGSTVSNSGTNIYVKHASGGDPKPFLPEIGDTIAFDGGAGSVLSNNFEVAYVAGVSLFATSPIIVYVLSVNRPYDGSTTTVSIADGDTLFNLLPTQILKLSGNKATGLNKSLMVVEETGEILTLNDFGFVVSGSQ